MGFEQLIGKIIGKYRIESILGQGGMGVVFKGTQLSLHRPVAIKMLPPQLAMDKDFLARFTQEAKIIAGLSHENIVYVYDIEQVDGCYFIIMEFIDGEGLNVKIKPHKPLPPEDIRMIGIAVSRALDTAHARGIIHRDIKSSNIMITRAGKVKLMDFGIARVSGSGVKTRTGAAIGTPEYMAPEQARGEPVTPQSDLYSLGVLLYEMAVGKLPFEADDPFATALKHVTETPVPPRHINPTVPHWLEQIILCLMSKNPNDRYRSAIDLEQALMAGGKSVSVAEQITTSIPVAHVRSELKPSLMERLAPLTHPGSHRWLRSLNIMLAIAAGLIVVVGAILLGQSFLKPQPIAIPEQSNASRASSASVSDGGTYGKVATQQKQPQEVNLPPAVRGIIDGVLQPSGTPALELAPLTTPTVITVLTGQPSPSPEPLIEASQAPRPETSPSESTQSLEDQVKLYLLQANEALQQGRTNAAERLTQQALNLIPNHPEALSLLAKCKARQEADKAARESTEEQQRQRSQEQEARAQEARAQEARAQEARAQEARAQEAKAPQAEGQRIQELWIQVEDALDQDDHPKAVTLLDKILSLDPNDSAAREKRDKLKSKISDQHAENESDIRELVDELLEAITNKDFDDFADYFVNGDSQYTERLETDFDNYKKLEASLTNLSVNAGSRSATFRGELTVTGVPKKSDGARTVIYRREWTGKLTKKGRSWKIEQNLDLRPAR